MKPTVNRAVHFYYESYHYDGDHHPMKPLAAIITNVNDDGTVGLAIFPPPTPPNGYLSPEGRMDVLFSETPTPGCWTWPPRV